MTTNYNDGLWHGWNGGECPVHPETLVAALFRDGSGLTNQRLAKTIGWSVLPPVAFRVIKEHKEPREFWICLGEIFDSEDDARIQYGSGPEIIHVREVIQ